MVLNFPVMSDTASVYDSETGKTIYMSHGHKYSPDSLPPIPQGSLFLSGHTHVLMIDNRGGVICVNPGSVSLPKNNNPKTYATYECGHIEIKTFDGEIIKEINL
jgi:predicted phosphodiesterase